MKFYNNNNKKLSVPGFIIGFIIAVIMMMHLTGCSSNQTIENHVKNDNVPATTNDVIDATQETETNVDAIETTEPEKKATRPSDTATSNTDVIPDTTPAATSKPNEPDTNGVETSTVASVNIKDDTIIDLGSQRVYGFTNTGYVGCGLDGTVMPYELYYGIYLETNGSKLTYRPYSYMDDVEPVDALIARNDDSEAFAYLTVDTNGITIDLRKQLNGLFIVMFQFSNNEICYGYIYVNDGNAYVVSVTTKSEDYVRKTIMTKADKLQALADADGITPENSLVVNSSEICYPVISGTDHRCDTDLWRALAHEIVPDDTLPDTLKVIMLHDWMTANLAYDTYSSHTLKVSRQAYYKDYTGNQSIYDLRTGVCRDFVNIFAIMCRELNIPCTDIGSDKVGHTWSLVYLNGEWRDLDFTQDIKRKTYGEDVTDITNSDVTICYDTFLRIDKLAYSIPTDTNVGHSIYTYNDVKYGFD